mgnify:CR=1 FL=1
MKQLCAIISGGQEDTLCGIEAADFIIACDRGYVYARNAGIRPDLLVGDFDSYQAPLPDDIPTVTLPHEKDDTDTLYAVRTALKANFAEIWFYCALGGRLDHTYANLQTAAFAAAEGVKVRFLQNETEIRIVHNTAVTIPAKKGFALSVFSMDNAADGVSIAGAQYNLDHAQITNTFPIGISNEFIDGNPVQISVQNGTLMIICIRAD